MKYVLCVLIFVSSPAMASDQIKTSPKEEKTKFDKFLEKKKKKYFKKEDLTPKKDEGLVDPLIDGANELSKKSNK